MSTYRSLNLPQSTPEARLQERLAALEEKARQIERSAGKIIDFQKIQGNNEAYSTTFVGAVGIYTNTAAGGGPSQPFSFSYTPPVDAWWDITLNVAIVQKLDAAYHYCYGYVLLNPADVDGVTIGYSLVTQHNAVNTFESRSVNRTFKLAAGVSYTVQALTAISGGSWNYYHGLNHLWMEARAIVR